MILYAALSLVAVNMKNKVFFGSTWFLTKIHFFVCTCEKWNCLASKKLLAVFSFP